MANLVPSRWLHSFDRLREEIDRTFERWLPRRPVEHDEDICLPSLWASCCPMVDMEEDEKEIRVMAELPGLEKDDFTVELRGDRLIISGEKKAGREEKKANYHYSECSYGSFSRALLLPCEAKADKIEAQYKNGILSLRLPKSKTAKARRVEVKVS